MLLGPEVEPAPWAVVFGVFAAPPVVPVPVPVPVAVSVPVPVPLLGVDAAAAAAGVGAVSAILYDSRVMCCAMGSGLKRQQGPAHASRSAGDQ